MGKYVLGDQSKGSYVSRDTLFSQKLPQKPKDKRPEDQKTKDQRPEDPSNGNYFLAFPYFPYYLFPFIKYQSTQAFRCWEECGFSSGIAITIVFHCIHLGIHSSLYAGNYEQKQVGIFMINVS